MFLLQEEEILPEETKQQGAVSAKTYLAYLRSFHNLGMGLLVIFLFVVCQVRIMQLLKTFIGVRDEANLLPVQMTHFTCVKDTRNRE